MIYVIYQTLLPCYSQIQREVVSGMDILVLWHPANTVHSGLGLKTADELQAGGKTECVSTKALDHVIKHVHGLHDVLILERETMEQS